MNAASFHVVHVLAAALGPLAGVSSAATVSPPEREPPTATQRIEAGPIVIEQAFDRSVMLAAERVTATWRVHAPLDVRVGLPPMPVPGSKAGDFAVVSCVDEPARLTGDPSRLVLVRRLLLEPFLPGTYATPTLEATWHRSDSEQGIARTSSTSITVESLLPSAASDPALAGEFDPGSIREEHRVESSQGNSWLIPAGAITALAVLGAAAVAGMRRRRGSEADPAAVALALAQTVDVRIDDPGSVRRALDDLAHSLRAALADRVTPLASAMAGEWLRSDGGARGGAGVPSLDDERRRIMEAALPLLDTLDEARFSGSTAAADHLARLRDEVVKLVETLQAMPRLHGGRRA